MKLIAYYLPQYYKIDFNDKYWGKGYTEWTVTENAKPLFKGHYQPHVPADLGFYNLLMPEARKAQADMAKQYGIDGFCYWNYWFGNGSTIMEKPLKAILENDEPNFPFCLCWANHSWHNPKTKEVILKQKYLGRDDYEAYFYSLLDAFKDRRYIRFYDGRLIFTIYSPIDIPDVNDFIDLWNDLAQKEGLSKFYFVGIAQTPKEYKAICHLKLDAINTIRLKDFLAYRNPLKERIKYILSDLHDYSYKEALKYFISSEDIAENIIPTIIPGWDHSPRGGRNSLILTDYTPQAFKEHLEQVFDLVSKKKNKLCFVKAWNEWGEGNHLEPDLKYGLSFLETLKVVKEKYLNLCR